ncbi:MAG: carbohydrate kinase family protein [Anaerolineales bacterium]|jgi:sugar/nucleoside kinase (ribokinase family)
MTEKQPCVVSFGDLVADMVVTIQRLPVVAGQHQIVRSIQIEPGGAGNFLIAGARLGMNMQALGVVGADEFGNLTMQALKAESVNTDHALRQPDGTTTTVLVLVDEQGQHVFLGQYGQGSLVVFSEDWREVLRSADAMIAWGYTLQEERLSQAMVDGMAFARSAGCPVFFDPGPYVAAIEQPRLVEVLAHCSGVLLTEEEIPLLSGGLQGLEGVQEIMRRGPELVCVKRGAKGCMLCTADKQVEHPGYPVTVRDTTAAGDSFAAGFLYGYLHGWQAEQVVAFANAVGAAKVRKLGSGRQVATLREVQELLQVFNVQVPFLT